MWSITVEGSKDDIYAKLKEKFVESHVTVSGVEGEPVTMRDGTKRGPGQINVTAPGVSEQFRRVQKSLQGIMEVFDGNLRVTVKGNPGKSLDMKVEVI